jgi:hypothetical protein
MEIIETIILIVAWLVTVIWVYGVRVRPAVVTTSLVSLSVLLVTLFFTLIDFSKYHLLWAIPVTMFLGTHIFVFITVHIPILNTIVIAIGKIYTEILRIGIGKAKRVQMQQGFEANTTSMLNELSAKKQKEFEDKKVG